MGGDEKQDTKEDGGQLDAAGKHLEGAHLESGNTTQHHSTGSEAAECSCRKGLSLTGDAQNPGDAQCPLLNSLNPSGNHIVVTQKLKLHLAKRIPSKNLIRCISHIPGTELGFAPLAAPASQGHVRLLAKGPRNPILCFARGKN